MKKMLFKLVVALICGISISCSSVTMLKPLPNNVSSEDREQFVGQWVNNDGSCHVNFDSGGVGKFASLKWDEEKGAFVSESHSFLITEIENEYYLSVFKENQRGSLLVKCMLSEDHVVIWGPDVERFEELIESKKLAGGIVNSKHSTEVALTNSPKDIIEILKNEKGLFLYKEPMILSKFPH